MLEKKLIKIAGEEYVFNIYTEYRNSTRVSITSRGVNIRLPRHLTKLQREKEIYELIHWAAKRLQNTSLHKEKKKKYQNGDYLKTHSKIYKLQIEDRDSQKNFSKINGSYIIFKISNRYTESEKQKYISKQLQKLLAKNHLDELKIRIDKINRENFGKDISKVSFKYTKSRWGACHSSRKEIDISTKLLLAPVEILDYVIVHELAHLIQNNHSKRFWQIVASVDPKYKQKKKWLNKYGNELNI